MRLSLGRFLLCLVLCAVLVSAGATAMGCQGPGAGAGRRGMDSLGPRVLLDGQLPGLGPVDPSADGLAGQGSFQAVERAFGGGGGGAVRGDFNGDGAVDLADVNLLYAVLGTTVPPTDAAFDLIPDGKVDIADARELVERIICTSLADTNLDRVVDVVDLGNLSNRYGQPGGFADGDTNGDGVVNVLDLGNLANDYDKAFP